MLNYRLKKKYMHYFLQISLEGIFFVKKNHEQYWLLKISHCVHRFVDILGAGNHLN